MAFSNFKIPIVFHDRSMTCEYVSQSPSFQRLLQLMETETHYVTLQHSHGLVSYHSYLY